MTKDEIIDAIKQMNVMELADVVKALEDECGISAAAPVAVAAAPAAADTRIAAPMLSMFRGFSSRTIGAGDGGAEPGLPSIYSRDVAGRWAIPITPVGGVTGASWWKTSFETNSTRLSKTEAMSGPYSFPNSFNSSRFTPTASSRWAPKRMACFKG